VNKEKEAWRQEKLQLEKEVSSLRQGEHSAKMDTEVRVLQVEKAKGEETSQLQSRIARLEAESQMLSERLVQATDARQSLEAERDQIRQRSTEEVRRVREQWSSELSDARQREEELMHMLHEVQESIITSGHHHDEYDDELAGESR